MCSINNIFQLFLKLKISQRGKISSRELRMYKNTGSLAVSQIVSIAPTPSRYYTLLQLGTGEDLKFYFVVK